MIECISGAGLAVERIIRVAGGVVHRVCHGDEIIIGVIAVSLCTFSFVEMPDRAPGSAKSCLVGKTKSE